MFKCCPFIFKCLSHLEFRVVYNCPLVSAGYWFQESPWIPKSAGAEASYIKWYSACIWSTHIRYLWYLIQCKHHAKSSYNVLRNDDKKTKVCVCSIFPHYFKSVVAWIQDTEPTDMEGPLYMKWRSISSSLLRIKWFSKHPLHQAMHSVLHWPATLALGFLVYVSLWGVFPPPIPQVNVSPGKCWNIYHQLWYLVGQISFFFPLALALQ